MQKITIIIPVKNGAISLDKCLKSICSQEGITVKLIIVDSGSTDDSVIIAEKYNAKIVNVKPSEFNHGKTRFEALQYATSDLIFFTVQDAWFGEADVLYKMSLHFVDEEVMSVTGHQAIPWGALDKNPAYWFKRISEAKPEIKYFSTPGSFDKLSPEQKVNICCWDDVIAMYRKRALIEIPFRTVEFSEDCIWAKDALAGGFKLIRDPRLLINHYHHVNFKYSFKTKFIVSYHYYSYFNYSVKIPWSPMGLIRASYTIMKINKIKALQKIGWLFYNLKISFATFASSVLFRSAIILGGKTLVDKIYQKVCHTIPQGNEAEISKLKKHYN